MEPRNEGASRERRANRALRVLARLPDTPLQRHAGMAVRQDRS